MSHKIGEIKYIVFTHPEKGEPWVCRMRLENISPKGKCYRYRCLDTVDEELVHCGWNSGEMPYDTPIEALKHFQIDRLNRYRFAYLSLNNNDDASTVINQICAANRMINEQSKVANHD